MMLSKKTFLFLGTYFQGSMLDFSIFVRPAFFDWNHKLVNQYWLECEPKMFPIVFLVVRVRLKGDFLLGKPSFSSQKQPTHHQVSHC